MWTYRQIDGLLGYLADGEQAPLPICNGYSGHGEGLNNPVLEYMANVGPIPRGEYIIGTAYDGGHLGRCVMSLTPVYPNRACGRTGLYMHGDKSGKPFDASHGCIVLDFVHRETIAQSSDRRLKVL